MGEILKCEKVKLTILKKVPCVTIELSNGIQVITTLESKSQVQLKTTASQAISLEYQKDEGTYDPNNEEEDAYKVLAIPETFISQLKNEKLNIIPEEGLD